VPDVNDPGLLTPAETGLLTDQYELAMAASYHRRDMNQTATFELFARHLPAHRTWLLAAGLGPTLRLVLELRFSDPELGYLGSIGFGQDFLSYLSEFRFTGDIDAIPEGTVCFANEPLLRVTGPRIEAQLLETLLLNQINFQTMVATKAARVVLAAGGGEPGSGDAVIDFSPRRDHGIDAAMKVARSAAVAGCGGTSNVAAAMRYGLRPVGTMAHSYVMSFEHERDAYAAFVEDFPESAVVLVDTYDTLEGVRSAIAASQDTGVPLRGVRLDSGDLLVLSREARRILDDEGMNETRIVASGDLEEHRITELVAAGAPIDSWGVGTELGTSRDSPVVNGVYKLVADRGADGWRGVWKRSPDKATHPGPKQVFRTYTNGTMKGDVIVAEGEEPGGDALLTAVMRGGEIVRVQTLDEIRERTAAQLEALPAALRPPEDEVAPYPVTYSKTLERAVA
jgi:nicotinate phosphoribosyltransferase